MSDTVISVENLSKCYLIGHQSTQRERYTALRDVIAREAHNFTRKALDSFRGRQIVQGDQVEEFWALRDVSFEVKRGEVLGIIGRNGAGKSTLLKILSRITEPTKGRAIMRGRVASLLEVGTGFHPELTGRENIFLNGAILGMKRAEINAKFDEIVAFAGVERFVDTPVKRYSSGMHVRLAFAVAAHLEPEILVIDEVLAVGDADFQKRCLGKMGEVARSGRTVLFVSHNMHAVEKLCRRAIYLEKGQIGGVYENARQAVASYLKNGANATPTHAWINNDKECASEYFVPNLLKVATAAEAGNPTDPFPSYEPIIVTISGIVREDDRTLSIGIALYSEDNELLFWTFSNDTPTQCWPQLAVGPVSLRTVLPANFLNDGFYRVQLMVALADRAWLIDPEAGSPAFVTFSISGALTESPLWNRKRPGPLAPRLVWKNC